MKNKLQFPEDERKKVSRRDQNNTSQKKELKEEHISMDDP